MKNILLSVVTFVLLLALAEFGFRLVGWTPGQFQYNQWLKIVDKLETIHGFCADENGIFKVDTAVAYDIQRKLVAGQIDPDKISNYCKDKNYGLEIGSIYTDHYYPKLKEGELWDRLANPSDLHADHDSLIHWFRSNPVNPNGFYAIPFDTDHVGKARVLIIGDSFAWGHSTSNKMLSFSNTLLARGYTVFNTGISGADLPQYNAILEQYFNQLQPDVVVVNLFMGNDIMPHERTVRPYQPILYGTNAGNVYSFQVDEQFDSREEAYQNVVNNMIVPQTTEFNRLASKTVISSLAWAVCAKIGLIDHKFSAFPDNPDYSESKNELSRIISFCEQKDVPLILSIVPELNGDELIGAEKFPEVFNDKIEYYESDLVADEYYPGDGHFNDLGHKAYADHLERLIEQKLNYER